MINLPPSGEPRTTQPVTVAPCGKYISLSLLRFDAYEITLLASTRRFFPLPSTNNRIFFVISRTFFRPTLYRARGNIIRVYVGQRTVRARDNVGCELNENAERTKYI